MTNPIETRKFDAEIGKILQLMIHSLYTNKDIFLRELISNASDACDKLRYAAVSNDKIDASNLGIKIEIQGEELIISDNGIGMTKEELINNLGTIASSGTQKFIEQLKSSDAKTSLQLIGQFGVGFYSAFMVASKVKVISTSINSEHTYVWESEGTGEYTIVQHPEKLAHGTTIYLKIKPEDVQYLQSYRVQHIIKTYSDHISFPISLIEEGSNTTVLNSASALWARPKAEISEEQYKEFYHHVAHAPDAPWMTLHNKTEGNVEYTSLLFIPSSKPFGLFDPDRKSRIKLYVKKVFITEDEPNLVPAYLRFLRGVVDSEDLPLNISRETFQHNQLIAKMRKSIVKRVLNALKAKAEEDTNAYNSFWANFGEVMKEGLCEGALEEKEQLLEVCRFYTNKSPHTLISLNQYVDNMIDGQEQIYFVTGDSVNNLLHHPQIEGFKARDIEVILLPDHVDDFWVNVVNQYKNKELCSITNSNIDLDKIKPINKPLEENLEDKVTDEALVSYVKKVLDQRVKDVKISAKLVDSPACISVPEGGMNIRMEKYLLDQKQLNSRTAKILELNPRHSIVERLSSIIEKDEDQQQAAALVEIIFNQACLVAGESMQDPYQYTKLVNVLLEKALAA
jgi:molecular chaperone HtpG